MSISGTSYSVARSTGHCAVTGRAFSAGERYVATLVERDTSPGEKAAALFERMDFSVEAWKQKQTHPPAIRTARFFGVWRASFIEHPTPQKQLLSDDELVDLFEQLGAADQPKQLAFRYVLALLLVRRRLLRVIGTKLRTADQPATMMVLPKGATAQLPALIVIDPGLDESAIAEVIEQVGQLIATDDEGEAAT